MNIAIVGSRGFTDIYAIRAAVKRWMVLTPEGVTIISGGARGADSLGELVAQEFSLPTIVHRPRWYRDGKYIPSAGFERNTTIVEDADVVLAFYAPGPLSRGTSDTVRKAQLAGKPVHCYHEGKWF
jgi:SLOG family YspA-like protein